MSATLLTGAAGQGKTRAAIEKIRRLRARKLFATVWVLLANDLQINAFRTRLLEEFESTGEKVTFGVEYFDFPALYTRLLDIAGTPQRRIRDAARFQILRYVLSEHKRELIHFAPIAETPGFVRLVADFIKELKQSIISPETFASAVSNSRDHDLALIYSHYQDFLRHHDLVDREGEGWLALARWQEMTEALPVELLIIDGYDQFDTIQIQLITLLAQRAKDTFLTLTCEDERAETAHRRFAETLRQLHAAASNINNGKLWERKPIARPTATRETTLTSLTKDLFEPHPTQVPTDGSLALIEAPDPRREVETVLRQVKKLIQEGTLPDQIAIVVRDLEAYSQYFLETSDAYGISLITDRGRPLSQNPAVATLLTLIDLAENQFSRRQTMDILRSIYLICPDLNPVQVELLDRITRAQVVVRGREIWFQAIDAAAKPPLIDSENYVESDALLSLSDQERDELIALRSGLASFFSRIEPLPESTPRDYIAWLEGLIGPDVVPDLDPSGDNVITAIEHFQMLARIRSDGEHRARDLAAMKCLKDVFSELLTGYELVNAYQNITWADFQRDLLIAIENTSINYSRLFNRSGRVLLGTVFQVRGQPHDHIFLLGLSESQFPAPQPEDALYLDTERLTLQRRHIPVLTRSEASDESSLFYEIVSLAHKTLTLLRPYIDPKGNEWPASPYWRAVQEVVAIEPERIPIFAGAKLDTAANAAEFMTTLAQSLNNPLTAKTLGAHQYLLAQADLAPKWQNALHTRQIEERRLSPQAPHDHYTGLITDPIMVAEIAQLLGPNRLWSASQFRDYGECPFQFLARRIFKLEVLEEPEEGLDQLQLGSLYHEILELTYNQVGAEQLTITPENLPRALEIFSHICAEAIPSAPQRYGFRATSLWDQEQHELEQKLRLLIRADFSGESEISKLLPGIRRPLRQEASFSGEQPLILNGPAGEIRVQGKIDRVDVNEEGRILVIDYKSGASKIPVEEMRTGRNVQMLLYVRAARQLFPDYIIQGGTFWHLGTRGVSGFIADGDLNLDDAEELLYNRIIEARHGWFTNTPSKMVDGKCSRYCQFSQLCRPNRAGLYKMTQDNE